MAMTATELLNTDAIAPGSRRQPWVRLACQRISGIFLDRDLARLAAVLAAHHPHVVDYLDQAPVLVAALARGQTRFSERALRVMAMQFIAAFHRHPKLNGLLRAHGIAPPLRRLRGRCLRPVHYGLLQQLSTLPSPVLGQILTQPALRQHVWVFLLNEWVRQSRRSAGDPDFAFAWAAERLAAVSLADVVPRTVRDVRDFAMAQPSAFDLRWTFKQAKAACQLAQADPLAATALQEAEFLARHGVGPDVVVDQAPPLPPTCRGGYTIVPLRTAAEVVKEGDVMNHCAARYVPFIAAGRCRLFSMRVDGHRAGTLEVLPMRRSSDLTYFRGQLKGPRNADPSEALQAAAASFVDDLNRLARAERDATSAVRHTRARIVALCWRRAALAA